MLLSNEDKEAYLCYVDIGYIMQRLTTIQHLYFNGFGSFMHGFNEPKSFEGQFSCHNQLMKYVKLIATSMEPISWKPDEDFIYFRPTLEGMWLLKIYPQRKELVETHIMSKIEALHEVNELVMEYFIRRFMKDMRKRIRTNF